jgi:hypothetical protein
MLARLESYTRLYYDCYELCRLSSRSVVEKPCYVAKRGSPQMRREGDDDPVIFLVVSGCAIEDEPLYIT